MNYITILPIVSRAFCDIIVPMNEEITPRLEVESKKTTKESIFELVRFGIIAVIIVVPIRIFIAQPFIVSGSSMVPTFQNGDYLIIDEISYRLGKPERMDVVVFRYPNDTKKFFIKRIIGLPEETIDIKNGTINISGGKNAESFSLTEPYIKEKSASTMHFELKEGEYFVMGDNRNASSDSRYWGAVAEDLMIGKALVRLWPIREKEKFPPKN